MHTRSIAMLASGIALVIIAGCGSNVETTGTGASAGSGTTTTTTTGGGGGAGGGGGTGGSNVCSAFHDQGGNGSVTVVFRNNTSQPIYLPGLCSGVAYDITPATGMDDGTYVYDKSCLQTCEDLQTSYAFACDACQSQTYRIEPGGTLSRVWDGTMLVGGPPMPDACWYMGTPELSSCPQIKAAPAGDYSITAMGFSDCQGGPCTCDAQGACVGVPGGQNAYPNPASFSFPSANTVEILFDFCAFGCPGPP